MRLDRKAVVVGDQRDVLLCSVVSDGLGKGGIKAMGEIRPDPLVRLRGAQR